MFRVKYFQYMNVYDNKGKYLGFIKDIAINYHKSRVIGFKLSSKGIFSKERYILSEDIIAMNEKVIDTKSIKDKFLCFSDIKSLDIIDSSGGIVGVLEDLIIDLGDYSIKGIVANPGILIKMMRGKEIILITETILGDYSIAYFGDRNKVKLVSLSTKELGEHNDEKTVD